MKRRKAATYFYLLICAIFAGIAFGASFKARSPNVSIGGFDLIFAAIAVSPFVVGGFIMTRIAARWSAPRRWAFFLLSVTLYLVEAKLRHQSLFQSSNSTDVLGAVLVPFGTVWGLVMVALALDILRGPEPGDRALI